MPKSMRQEGSLREVYEGIARKTRPTQHNPKSMTKRSLAMFGGVVVPKVGNRRDVFNGKAMRTSGGLTKQDLKLNSDGSIVSRRASSSARRHNTEGRAKLKVWRWAVSMANQSEGRRKGGQNDEAYIAAPKKGSRLYNTAKRIYNKQLAESG